MGVAVRIVTPAITSWIVLVICSSHLWPIIINSIGTLFGAS